MPNVVTFPRATVFAVCVHYTAECGELRVHQHPRVYVSRTAAIEAAPTVAEEFGLIAWIDEIDLDGSHVFCYVDGEALVTPCTIA